MSGCLPAQDKEHFAALAVDAILRLKGSGNLEAIHILKKPGGALAESFLDEVRAAPGTCWLACGWVGSGRGRQHAVYAAVLLSL